MPESLIGVLYTPERVGKTPESLIENSIVYAAAIIRSGPHYIQPRSGASYYVCNDLDSSYNHSFFGN